MVDQMMHLAEREDTKNSLWWFDDQSQKRWKMRQKCVNPLKVLGRRQTSGCVMTFQLYDLAVLKYV